MRRPVVKPSERAAQRKVMAGHRAREGVNPTGFSLDDRRMGRFSLRDVFASGPLLLGRG